MSESSETWERAIERHFRNRPRASYVDYAQMFAFALAEWVHRWPVGTADHDPGDEDRSDT